MLAESSLPDLVKMAARPDRAATMFSGQQSMPDRMDSMTITQLHRLAIYHNTHINTSSILSSTLINVHQRPSTTINDHQRPSTTINDHQRPSTTINDHQRPSTTINARSTHPRRTKILTI
ncbi:hypothetical protein PENNAL_c0136G09544, partial [Penicillium nalgiovense]